MPNDSSERNSDRQQRTESRWKSRCTCFNDCFTALTVQHIYGSWTHTVHQNRSSLCQTKGLKARSPKDFLLWYLPHGRAAIDSLVFMTPSMQPLTTLFGSIKLAFPTLPQSHIIPFWAAAARTRNHLCAATNLQFSPIAVARRNDLFSLFSKAKCCLSAYCFADKPGLACPQKPV